ncbi:uncharacterized protein LOC143240583 isoform X2 [Tachypleus tridentatus]|uniref:uncharacterized protein LOC143240583 isoform X2 n=1 Tax=Tachypleus tridentatus TaxID=6853 RepID=UPI003FD4882D
MARRKSCILSFRESRCLSNDQSSRPRLDSYDRFIPRRDSLDLDVSYFKLISELSQKELDDDVFQKSSPSQVAKPSSEFSSPCETYERRMTCLTEGASKQRILSFTPVCKKRRHKYNSYDITPPKEKPKRHLPFSPVKVLDLPDLVNDQFTHVLDWGNRGYIVAALKGGLYICKVEDMSTRTVNYREDTIYTAVAWNSKGRLLASGTDSGEIEVWDIKELKNVFSHKHKHPFAFSNEENRPSCRIICLTWNPSTDILSSGCQLGEIQHWDPHNGKQIHKNDPVKLGHPVCVMKYSTSGNYLACGGYEGTLHVNEGRTGTTSFSKTAAHSGALRALAWYPWRASLLATGGNGNKDGLIRLWNVYTGQNVAEVNTTSKIYSLLWGSRKQDLFSSQTTDENNVVLWAYPTFRCVGKLPKCKGRILHMVKSPCGTQLVSYLCSYSIV